jgi:hypothetical protein
MLHRVAGPMSASRIGGAIDCVYQELLLHVVLVPRYSIPYFANLPIQMAMRQSMPSCLVGRRGEGGCHGIKGLGLHTVEIGRVGVRQEQRRIHIDRGVLSCLCQMMDFVFKHWCIFSLPKFKHDQYLVGFQDIAMS